MFHLLNCYVVHYDDCPVFAFSWPSVLTAVSVNLKAEVPALMSNYWMRPTADQQQKQSDWFHLSRESRHTHPTTTTTMGVCNPHGVVCVSLLPTLNWRTFKEGVLYPESCWISCSPSRYYLVSLTAARQNLIVVLKSITQDLEAGGCWQIPAFSPSNTVTAPPRTALIRANSTGPD